MVKLPLELELLANTLQQAKQLEPEDVPDIDLYMDQLVTLLDTRLNSLKPDSELPFVTSTMVNNYAKAGLLPPIKKKRYTRAHALALVFIGQLKRVFSIMQLKKIIKKSNLSEDNFSMEIYKLFNDSQRECLDDTYNELLEAYNICKNRGLEGDALIAGIGVYIGAKAQYKSILVDRVLALLDDNRTLHSAGLEKSSSDDKVVKLCKEGRVS